MESLVLPLVVLVLLLLPQVFVFGRLKTHGYHLRARQHPRCSPGVIVGGGVGGGGLLAFESGKKAGVLAPRPVRFGSGQENRCPCRDVFGG